MGSELFVYCFLFCLFSVWEAVHYLKGVKGRNRCKIRKPQRSGDDSNSRPKGLFRLGRRRGIMSDEFKYELAKDLGFYDTVKNGGWGEIRARDAGNMVKRAIELAQQHMAQEENQR
jgi:hypothetical protein